MLQHLGSFFQRPGSIDSFWTKICSSLFFVFFLFCTDLLLGGGGSSEPQRLSSCTVFLCSLSATWSRVWGFSATWSLSPGPHTGCYVDHCLGSRGVFCAIMFSLLLGDHHIGIFVSHSFCCYLSCCCFYFSKLLVFSLIPSHFCLSLLVKGEWSYLRRR